MPTSLGANSKEDRRLGRDEPTSEADRILQRQREEKHTAIVAQGSLNQALARDGANYRSVDDMLQHVAWLYSDGTLKPEDHAKVALLAWSCGLNPNPASGQIYAWYDVQKYKVGNVWKERQVFRLWIGYQAYITRAEQQYIYDVEYRPMNQVERDANGLQPEDWGMVGELYEDRKVSLWLKMGRTPVPIKGIGVVYVNHKSTYEDEKGQTKTKTRTEKAPDKKGYEWLACKRALVDCLKKLGINFDIPKIDGMQYNQSTQTYISTGAEVASLPSPNAEPIEADYVPSETVMDIVEDAVPTQPPAVNGSRPYAPDVFQAKAKQAYDSLLAKGGSADRERAGSIGRELADTLAVRFVDVPTAEKFLHALWEVSEVEDLTIGQVNLTEKFVNGATKEVVQKEIADYVASLPPAKTSVETGASDSTSPVEDDDQSVSTQA